MAVLKERLLSLLNKLFELPPGTLNGTELLNDSEMVHWTSMELIGFIAICDEQFNIVLSASEVLQARKVSDLIVLVENKVNSSVAV